MRDLQRLWEIGPFTVTTYSLFVGLAALTGLAVTWIIGSREKNQRIFALSLWTAFGAWIGARLVYIATCWDYIMVDLGGVSFLVSPWEGGYTLWGGVLGGALAAWLYARSVKLDTVRCLDQLAPGAAAALTLLRVGEAFTTQGLGDYVENDSFHFFPFTVLNSFSDPSYDFYEYQIPVFFWEALAALIICVICILALRKTPGRSATLFLGLLSVTQILLESLREDDFIRFGFVRFNQIMAAVVLFALLLIALRSVNWKGVAVEIIIFFVCIGILIGIEFALDKSQIPNNILYGVMALTLIGLGILVLRPRKSPNN